MSHIHAVTTEQHYLYSPPGSHPYAPTQPQESLVPLHSQSSLCTYGLWECIQWGSLHFLLPKRHSEPAGGQGSHMEMFNLSCISCRKSIKKKKTQDSQHSSKQARLNFAFRNGKSQEGNTHNGGGYLSSGWYLSTGAQALQLRAQASTAGQQPTPAEWPCLSCYGVASIASVKIQTERRSSEPSRL